MMKEFFQNLKEKREEKDFTLEEIQRSTYLPLKYLEAIESGKMEILPSGYDRIYLKRYAAEIGLDSDEVLRDYDMLSGRLPHYPTKVTKEVEAPQSRILEDPQPDFKYKSQKSVSNLDKLNLDKLYKYLWISLAALIVCISGFFTYRQYINEKNDQITFKEIPSSEVSGRIISLNSRNVNEDSKENPLIEKINKPLEDKGKLFVIELKAVDTTWVRQIKDGKDTTEYILPTGLKHRVEAREEVKFMIGKADGIEFWLNGENLGKMGQANEVVLNLIISDKGIVDKTLKKIKKKPEVKNDSTIAVVPILY